MGICVSKNSSYIEPSVGSNNIINLYMKVNKELQIKSLKDVFNAIENEELKKEYYYIRKLIIVSIFLKDLPTIFNNDYNKMKQFLENNRIPSNIYNNIYNYHNNIDNSIHKYITNENVNTNIDENNIINSLNLMRGYIYDIILI